MQADTAVCLMRFPGKPIIMSDSDKNFLTQPADYQNIICKFATGFLKQN